MWPMSSVFRDGSPFVAWVAAVTIGLVILQLMNPAIWYSADVLGTARVVAAVGQAVVAGLAGAVIGALIGVVAGLIDARRELPEDRKVAARELRSRRARNGRIVAGGLVVGLALGGYNLVFTQERASFAACTAIQKDYDDARAALGAGEAQRTLKLVEDGLGRQKGCTGSAGGKLMTGGLYALRGEAYFQTDLLPARSDKEIQRAAYLIRNCRKDVAGTDRMPMCEQLLAEVEAYSTRHFCDDAVALANRADNEIFTNASAAKRDAAKGVTAAGKCKNPFNYAYRGVALAQVGQAQVKLGEPAAPALRESQKLVARCLRELGGARSGLANECRAAQKTVAAALRGRAP
jgi:hypothetical protein